MNEDKKDWSAHTHRTTHTTRKHTTFNFIEIGKGFFFFIFIRCSFHWEIVWILVSCKNIIVEISRSSSVQRVTKCSSQSTSLNTSFIHRYIRDIWRHELENMHEHNTIQRNKHKKCNISNEIVMYATWIHYTAQCSQLISTDLVSGLQSIPECFDK